MGFVPTALTVEGVEFPPTVKPPGSPGTLFLGGAGVRSVEIEGRSVKVTAIAVYLEDAAVSVLARKWKGRSTEELAASVDFFRDVITGSFEKFTRVCMILPLTGVQYSEKVTENCVEIWKSAGIYTDAEAEAVVEFKLAFKDRSFPPASSILFTHSATGSLTIAFSDDGSIPETGAQVIVNRALAEAILESIIGEHGVSPEAKRSLASRLVGLFEDATVGEEEKKSVVDSCGGVEEEEEEKVVVAEKEVVVDSCHEVADKEVVVPEENVVV